MDSSMLNATSTLARKQSSAFSSVPPPLPPGVASPTVISTYQEALEAWQEVVSFDLNAITAQERSEALEDIHCVGEGELGKLAEARSALLLDEFDELARKEQNPIYEMALKSPYIQDPAFRYRFLKCNGLNVKESVRQMMIYLQYKAAYFGEEKVAQEFTLNDLNGEEQEALYSGLFHIQKDRDQAGRMVVHVMTHMLGNWRVETVIRVAHCIWNSIILPDSITQTRGVVTVLYQGSSSPHAIPDSNFLITLVNVLLSFPLRYSAMHVCLKTEEEDHKGNYNLAIPRQPFVEAINLLPLYTRVRTRIHLATDVVLRRNLQSHGLSLESHPIDVEGNARMEILNEWIFDQQQGSRAQAAVKRDVGSSSEEDLSMETKRRSMYPSSENDSDGTNFVHVFDDDVVEANKLSPSATFEGRAHLEPPNAKTPTSTPTSADVLLGRGWRLQNHEGNVRFRTFLEGLGDAYDRSPRLEKRTMARNLVESMQRQGTRFLKQSSEHDGGGWIDSTMVEAENKVSQVFRTIRKNRQGNKKRKAI